MNKPMMNLQDSFLNQVRKDNSEIKLLMLDGTQLAGHVRGFDNFTVIMMAEGSLHMIYKHAIAQIVQSNPTQNHERRPARESRHDKRDAQSPGKAEEADPAKKFNTLDLSGVEIEKNE